MDQFKMLNFGKNCYIPRPFFGDEKKVVYLDFV